MSIFGVPFLPYGKEKKVRILLQSKKCSCGILTPRQVTLRVALLSLHIPR